MSEMEILIKVVFIIGMLGSSLLFFFFFKHNTAYEWRISDWSSDVCSSDLHEGAVASGEAPSIGRWSWLAAGLPQTVPGFQLDRRCGSGLQAIIEAAMMVQTGAADVVVAGGAESMSNVEHYS